MFFSYKGKKYTKYHYLNYHYCNAVFSARDELLSYGIQVLENDYLEESVLTAVLRLLKKNLPKETVITLFRFPDCYISRKPQEVRMGKGKGNPDEPISYVKKGHVLFLVQIPPDLEDIVEVRATFKECLQKLPIRARIIKDLT
jgi:large subunit ribosomal protein L16